MTEVLTMTKIQIKDIIDLLINIKEDNTTPKNTKERMDNIIDMLKGEVDTSIKVNKALDELDELVSDNNIQQYTRTQIWNVVSLLEKI